MSLTGTVRGGSYGPLSAANLTITVPLQKGKCMYLIWIENGHVHKIEKFIHTSTDVFPVRHNIIGEQSSMPQETPKYGKKPV